MNPKKKIALILLVGALFACLATASAAEAGSPTDPFISLNWIWDSFFQKTLDKVNTHADQQMNTLTEQLSNVGTEGIEMRVKRGDVIRMETGSSLILMAGELSVSASGAILDLSEGIELPAGKGNLEFRHRYMVAENTQAAFSVISDTAVIRLVGAYQVNPSNETDYNALADALKACTLFTGSGKPYGSGYELERGATRAEGLVMLLQLLGEIQEASQFKDDTLAFVDIPQGHWALPFVSYAYRKGYTAGRGVTADGKVLFGVNDLVTPRDYLTFTMLALGYTGKDFTWANAVEDLHQMGILTDGEVKLLSEKTFLRAQVVYLSWVALSTNTAGGEGTLFDRLVSSGALNQETSSAALQAVTVPRL